MRGRVLLTLVAVVMAAVTVAPSAGQSADVDRGVNRTSGTVMALTPLFSNLAWSGNQPVSVTIQVPGGFSVSQGVRYTKCAGTVVTGVFSTLDTCSMGNIDPTLAASQIATSEMEFGTTVGGVSYRYTATLNVGVGGVSFEAGGYVSAPPPPSPPPPSPLSPPPPPLSPPPPRPNDDYVAYAGRNCSGPVLKQKTFATFTPGASRCEDGNLFAPSSKTWITCTSGDWEVRACNQTACDEGINATLCDPTTTLARDTCYYLPSLNISVMLDTCETNDKDCFPGNARVTMASGAVKRMDELVLGDALASIDPVSGVRTAAEFMGWAKVQPQSLYVAVVLVLDSGASLTASRTHYVHFSADGGESWTMGPMESIQVGYTVRTADGSTAAVVGKETRPVVGAYSPITTSTRLVVDGVGVSMWTSTSSFVLKGALRVGKALGLSESQCRFMYFAPYLAAHAVLPPWAWAWVSHVPGGGQHPIINLQSAVNNAITAVTGIAPSFA